MPIITENWDKVIGSQYNMPYLGRTMQTIKQDLQNGKVICPKINDIFRALRLTDYLKIKVVILGQDPYNSAGAADGLAFSSNKITPALKIIFDEIKGCTGQVRTKTELDDWASQGVLLLNTILTTLQGSALAHKHLEWEQLTRFILQRVNELPQKLVIMLWGSHAIQYHKYFDGARHLILKAPHPQSDNYGNYRHTFRGTRHFEMCNDFMQSNNKSQIRWGDPIINT